MSSPARTFRCRDKTLVLDRTRIMGILNVTPDSFSDGKLFLDPKAAIEHALRMVEGGADIIDIGGESTRPGAGEVSSTEEIDRILPVIEALVNETEVPLSVDTYKAATAEAALKAGVHIVNDISGFRFDPEMASVAAKYNAAAVLMHIRGTPRNMQKNPTYNDVVGEIKKYLEDSVRICSDYGIENVMINPGIGFGKTVAHNLEILRRLKEFRTPGCPLLVGTSRKSFIGKITGAEVDERMPGSVATAVVAVMNGADLVRVHDVAETRQAVDVLDRIIGRVHAGP